MSYCTLHVIGNSRYIYFILSVKIGRLKEPWLNTKLVYSYNLLYQFHEITHLTMCHVFHTLKLLTTNTENKTIIF